MLGRSRRAVAGGAVIAIGAVGLAAPAAQAKSSHAVKVHVVGKLDGIKLSGKVSGSPFGSCKYAGTLIIPKTKQVWSCKGGKIKLTGTGTTGAADKAAGTWVITGGTGKYKGAKGKGKFSGLQSKGEFDYTGTVVY